MYTTNHCLVAIHNVWVFFFLVYVCDVIFLFSLFTREPLRCLQVGCRLTCSCYPPESLYMEVSVAARRGKVVRPYYILPQKYTFLPPPRKANILSRARGLSAYYGRRLARPAIAVSRNHILYSPISRNIIYYCYIIVFAII